MKFAQIALLLLVSLKLSLALAGPDVVNNGGGLAEAKAYSLLAKVDDFARACVASCSLTSEQLHQLQLLESQFATESHRIEFDEEIRESQLSKNIFKLAHQDVYETDGVPKNAGAIVALLLKLKAAEASSETDWITSSFSKMEERTISLPLGEKQILHVIRFSEMTPIVLLEKESVTEALTQKIEEAIGCANRYELGDFSAYDLGGGVALAEAPIEWTCRTKKSFAKVRLLEGRIQLIGVTDQ